VSVQVNQTVSVAEERLRKLRAELTGIDQEKLLHRLDFLNDRERRLKIRVLLYLKEIDRRRFYLEWGYCSMFSFCTEYLKYSESTAVRRIKAERALGRSKRVISMLLSGEITVTGLSKIESICKPENTDKILEQAAGCSCRELDRLRARHCPEEPKPEKVRPVFIKTELKVKDNSKSGRKITANVEGAAVLEEKYRLDFSVSADSMKKINRVKNLLSTKYPEGITLETLLDELLESYLEKNDPDRREDSGDDIKTDNSSRSRYIPQKVRDLVYKRDGARCSFVGRNGKRCGSRWNLQIDHIVPYGKGGDNSPENLRLLCGRHNRLMAEREYGREHMKSSC